MTLEKNDLIDQLIEDWKKERPDLDASPMEIVGRILKLGKTLEKRASVALKQSNINYTDLDVLATLRRSGVPYELTPTQLMQSVIISSGALTALLDRLTKLNLIYRLRDEKDGRVKRACLTQDGIVAIDKAIETRFYEAKTAINMLDKSEKKDFSALLKKMLATVEN